MAMRIATGLRPALPSGARRAVRIAMVAARPKQRPRRGSTPKTRNISMLGRASICHAQPIAISASTRHATRRQSCASTVRGKDRPSAMPIAQRKAGKTRSVGVKPCHSAWSSGHQTCAPDPGVLTMIIAATVSPRKLSSAARRGRGGACIAPILGGSGPVRHQPVAARGEAAVAGPARSGRGCRTGTPNRSCSSASSIVTFTISPCARCPASRRWTSPSISGASAWSGPWRRLPGRPRR